MAADAGFVPRIRHEVSETSTLVTLVAAGLGVAVVPAPTADLDVLGVAYRPLLPDTLGVDLVAARLTATTNAVVDRALEVLRRDWSIAQRDGRSLTLIHIDVDGCRDYLDVFGRSEERRTERAIDGSSRNKEKAETVPARIVWTRFCNSGCLSDGISLASFEG